MKQVYRIVFFVLGIITASAESVFSQQAPNADSLYTLARTVAFDNKDYPAAIALSKQALQQSPNYTDIVLFLGRIYTWSEQPDSARTYFEAALRQQPASEDIYAGYTDLEYWNKNYDTALTIVDRGIVLNTTSVPLWLRKAKVLVGLEMYDAAMTAIDTVLALDPGNTEARSIAAQIKDRVSKNRIGVKHDYVYFDKQFPDPWSVFSIDYTRQTKIGPFTARASYGNRFQNSGMQYEVEAYPILSRTFYTYANIGFSDNDKGVFPKWKAGASLYANLPKAWESELGIRYLYFSSDIFFYTAYIGKYCKSFLLGARTYLTPTNTSTAQAYSAMIRYYFGGADDYISLTGGAGISPDDRRINVQLNDKNYHLRTYSGELIFRKAIRKIHIITANFSLLNQEYQANMTGNQVQAGLGYIRRF